MKTDNQEVMAMFNSMTKKAHKNVWNSEIFLSMVKN
jgi:hypothetical protein